MRIIGFVLVVAGTLLALGANLTAMLDVVSTVIVVGLTLFGLLAGFGRRIGAAFRAVFTSRPGRDALLTGLAVLERGKGLAVGSGVLGALIGMVVMLMKLDSPADLGPGMALDLLTILYGIGLAYGLFLPLQASLRQKLAQEMAEPEPEVV
ncbi:MAG: MotA/TolQ/ExbB proton channel family protein [Candidatus Latescibacterota bacterium]